MPTERDALLQFRRLPAEELKIDRGFVREMLHSEADRGICQHMIPLAHHFGMKVVTGGVEDQPTLDRLRNMGCDMVLGYRVARPMAAGAVGAWVRAFDGASPGT